MTDDSVTIPFLYLCYQGTDRKEKLVSCINNSGNIFYLYKKEKKSSGGKIINIVNLSAFNISPWPLFQSKLVALKEASTRDSINVVKSSLDEYHGCAFIVRSSTMENARRAVM